jgi:AcrR family transcriptional regulator
MGKDTEVHSGYYTEGSSVLQAGSVRYLMNMMENPREEAADEPRMRADARRSRAKLLEAATAAFAEHGADAPLEDIARRAGVGIGTLYRHFPTRTDLQAAVFRSQVQTVCAAADEYMISATPDQALSGWLRAMAAYLATKRGLSRALVDALGRDSELITSCWGAMNDAAERLMARAQDAGLLRDDVKPIDVLRMVHGVVIATEQVPEETDRLLGLVLDGLRARTPESS